MTYRLFALFMFIILCTLMVAVGYKLNKGITAQQQTIDSLQTELFIKSADLGRYEMSLELLGQQDTVAANKFLNIYNNETE